MAKKPKSDVNVALLSAINTATLGGSFMFVNEAEALQAGLKMEPPLIECNQAMRDPNDNAKVAARSTEAGKVYVGNVGIVPVAQADTQSPFAVLSGIALPESKKRGGGKGAPTIYPFAALEVGQHFFVPKTADRPNPAKTLGSMVSSKNIEYASQTGTEAKEVTERDPATKKAKIGPDGKKVRVTKQMPVYKYNRKFVVRAVEAGKAYGGWVAPADGAVVARVPLDAS